MDIGARDWVFIGWACIFLCLGCEIRQIKVRINLLLCSQPVIKEQGNCHESSSTYKKVYFIDQGVKGSRGQVSIDQAFFFFFFIIVPLCYTK